MRPYRVALVLLAVMLASTLPDGVQFQEVVNSLPQNQTGRVSAVNYNGDGSSLLSLTNGVITLWTRSASGNYVVSQTFNPQEAVQTARLSIDGSKIAAGGSQSRIYLWSRNAATGRY